MFSLQPALLKRIPPCEILQETVREYQVFRFLFDEGVSPPVKFYAPRPEHSITFYVCDAQRFSYINSPTIQTYPACVVNGIYSIPILRYGGNDFLAIKVVLQPATLFQLLKIPLQPLTNTFLNAEELWGNKVSLVCEQLRNVNTIDEMIIFIEIFLKHLLKNKISALHPVDRVANYLLKRDQRTSLDWLASQSCLSTRQFIRKFEEHTGIGAKSFQRIIRFDKAFRMKNLHPNMDWLSIALNCEYYDYQHLVKDFKEFTQLTPTAFFDVEKTSPERIFGFVEN